MEEISSEIQKVANNKEHKFVFTGNGLTFFKIWIVNMFLSVITFGFYSPWAKVRNNQYIYGSTTLNDLPFEYTAKPVRILIGRLIVVGFYAVYLLLANVFGMNIFTQIFLGCFMLLIPFLIRQTICFRMRYTRYSGINFHHLGTVFHYYKYFILHFVLNIVTLGLAFPYSMREFKALLIGKTSYGDTEFDFKAGSGQFYMVYLKALLVSFLFIFIIGVASALAETLFFYDENFSSPSSIDLYSTISIFIGVVMYFFILIMGSFMKGAIEAWIGNVIYNSISINNLNFKAKWSPWRLGWINFSNLIVLLLTLGFMYPWAKIRILKYKLAHVNLEGEGLENFIDSKKDEALAIGEESADFFDIDIGI